MRRSFFGITDCFVTPFLAMTSIKTFKIICNLFINMLDLKSKFLRFGALNFENTFFWRSFVGCLSR